MKIIYFDNPNHIININDVPDTCVIVGLSSSGSNAGLLVFNNNEELYYWLYIDRESTSPPTLPYCGYYRCKTGYKSYLDAIESLYLTRYFTSFVCCNNQLEAFEAITNHLT